MRKLSLIERLTRVHFISQKTLLEFYPPFWFMGVRITHSSEDNRRMHVHLPLRWYGKNLHGTMFGGFMCAVSDPLAALLCARIFPGVEVWTKAHRVEFIRPARTGIDLEVTISDSQVESIERGLKEKGSTTETFEFSFHDKGRKEVARATNTVFFRIKNQNKSNT